jgi:Zn-dependent protease with chaperone function
VRIAAPLALIGASLILTHDLWEPLVVTIFRAYEPRVHALYAGVDGVRRRRAALNVRNRHRALVAILGRPTDDRDVYVVDAPDVAAYCVPGAGRSGQIVVTSAGRRLLTEAELAASVESRRPTNLLAPLGLVRNYSAQTRRPVEMAADDQAASRCGREARASALLTLAAATGPAEPPLSMTGSSTAERIRRLLEPADPDAPAKSPAIFAVAFSAMLVPLALLVVPAASLAGTAHPAKRSTSSIRSHQVLPSAIAAIADV